MSAKESADVQVSGPEAKEVRVSQPTDGSVSANTSPAPSAPLCGLNDPRWWDDKIAEMRKNEEDSYDD